MRYRGYHGGYTDLRFADKQRGAGLVVANIKKYRIEDIVGTFIAGDCEQEMKKIPTESIDLIATSSPYDDKRNYGVDDGTVASDDYISWFAYS